MAPPYTIPSHKTWSTSPGPPSWEPKGTPIWPSRDPLLGVFLWEGSSQPEGGMFTGIFTEIGDPLGPHGPPWAPWPLEKAIFMIFAILWQFWILGPWPSHWIPDQILLQIGGLRLQIDPFWLGSRLNPAWIQPGSSLDPGQIQAGSSLDPGWIQAGSSLDPAWSQPESSWIQPGSTLASHFQATCRPLAGHLQPLPSQFQATYAWIIQIIQGM